MSATIKVGLALALVLVLAGAGWYARAVLAERDQLRADLAGANRTIERQSAAITRAHDDARTQAATADKLIADRDAHALRAADLLRRARGMPVITEPAAACAASTSTNAGRDHATGECGLSVADRARLESRLARVRETTLEIGADADRVALQLTAAQAEIVRLRAYAEGVRAACAPQ